MKRDHAVRPDRGPGLRRSRYGAQRTPGRHSLKLTGRELRS